MARISNVRLRTGRFYTIKFTRGILAFVEYLYFKDDILYFEVIGSTERKGNMLYPGKIIKGKKEHLNRKDTVQIRNMSKSEMVLYGKKHT